jgi:hypothetical protein
MRRRRLTPIRPALALWALAALSTVALADDYKIETFQDALPAALAGPVRAVLAPQGYRVLDGEGKVYAEIWLRKAIPASEAPAGPKGAILYPFLSESELLGALRFPEEGHDNRDQTIARGVYTLRYGFQPVNGDHLGISPHRDYALLLPAAKDTALTHVARKPLEEKSAESAGTSHPAILMLVAPAPGAKVPSMKHDLAKDSWGAVVPLSLEVKGTSGAATQNVQIILIGVFGS